MTYEDLYRLSVHAVITDEQQRIFVLKANYGSHGWGLPGGSIDMGETIHEALQRECLEELGCSVEICYMSGVYYHKVHRAHAFIFRCTLPEKAQIRLSNEHSEYAYFSLDRLNSVQRQRVNDCLEFAGEIKSAAF